MAILDRSTYVFGGMIDIVEIPTANLMFFTMTSTKKVSLDDSNNNRQPEVASITGNTYISETMTDDIEIPTANQSRICERV